jgi:hypothetical protein
MRSAQEPVSKSTVGGPTAAAVIEALKECCAAVHCLQQCVTLICQPFEGSRHCGERAVCTILWVDEAFISGFRDRQVLVAEKLL